MKSPEYEDFPMSYFMHKAIFSDDYLTITRFANLGDDAPELRKPREFFHTIDDILHDTLGSDRAIETHIIISLSQVGQSARSPDDFSQENQALIFLTASAWGIPLPCRISRSPFAICSSK